MMKSLVMTGLLAAAYVATAEIKQPSPEDLKLIDRPYQSLTDEEKVRRNAAFHQRELIENGGMMLFPGTPSGTIRYVNLQKRVPKDDLKKAMKAFGSMMQYDVAIVDSDCAATLKIKIVDDPAAPTMLVAPEERWAQVNIAKLGDDKTAPAYLAARVRKEMLRAFAFLTAGSSNDMPLFRPISKPSDLDQVGERGFPFDVVMRTKSYLEAMSVIPREQASYRAVLQAGYDVAPTNEIQKAIYERVRKETKLTKQVK